MKLTPAHFIPTRKNRRQERRHDGQRPQDIHAHHRLGHAHGVRSSRGGDCVRDETARPCEGQKVLLVLYRTLSWLAWGAEAGVAITRSCTSEGADCVVELCAITHKHTLTHVVEGEI